MSTSTLPKSPLTPVSPNRLGFCQRCGDPISNKMRCSKCGGTSKAPHIPAARKPDPWTHRYVNPLSFPVHDTHEPYLHDQPPPSSPKRLSHDPALGFGMPSRITRDLRSSLTTTPLERLPSQDYTNPLITGSDGVLSKVCGSMVEPSSSRNRWSCDDCKTIFARDSTLYAPPQSATAEQGGKDVFYCKSCYARRYSLGECRGCGKDVLGSTKEDGKFVKGSGGIWHGRCWKCSLCGDAKDVLVGMDGMPVCESCFDRPRGAKVELSKGEVELPDVRRVTRAAATRTGAMGATIAELTKKLGQQSVSSTRSSSSTSLPQSTSHGSVEVSPRSPSKSQYAFANNAPASPGKMSRSGSLTGSGSPTKPRPLTAQFRDGLNLAAFQSSFAGGVDGEDERVRRRDSRSRSVSPVKRPESKEDAVSSRTVNGFPRPLNSPTKELHASKSPSPSKSAPPEPTQTQLEPAQGATRCSACHLLPFEAPSNNSSEVVMVTLPDNVHLHASCFRCSICNDPIDGSKSFVRLDSAPSTVEGLSAYAHPRCSPTIQISLQRSREVEGKGFRAGLDVSSATRVGKGSHATHQRELKPSPVPSPAPSLRERDQVRPTVVASFTADASKTSHSTSGAAARTTPQPNPAAGIFSRLSAISTASSNPSLLTNSSPTTTPSRSWGGMAACPHCGLSISALESTLGPRGTVWHKPCLICRSPAPPPSAHDRWSRKPIPTICGKKLDSGAKVNKDGEVRCRDCYDRDEASFKVKR
ncbi:hypothetical protein PHSY_001823 [Pseudozyma hubeiensis SY62]|uniref:LIM zinc-binding domain-containing protein n=1 Tax=Pseudozyma hubeiensis (strain SY62) TaxID=1305764 RepID=R9NZT3_PSEHS|nr:hypothetical protein PHSY_001823 [Pseudozyma hubeiensis SY62]GAC94252.1 hypothetical protein PHSY_001823 [Pseudozyma hubeiensis SY62]